eukprot:TRINITY_DN542_c0_g1_i2.p1 TRINITY_DN542_c0_g1~~TRINITY_DN542_c0_g1_i2.p1  ORF type:complete len:386 (+),score=51.32 TRINITY_DN542_c0_g1_i2:504-1661(+)
MKGKRLWTFGLSSSGRLGHRFAKDKGCGELPAVLKTLEEVSINCVSCSSSQTGVTNASGHVYMFGGNNTGCLGLGTGVSFAGVPTRVEGPLLREFVDQVSCGEACTIFRTSSGKIFTAGGCDLAPVQPFGKKEFAIDACCGYNHFLVLTERKQVWSWGGDNYKQLGRTNSHRTYSEPGIVEITMGEPSVVACGSYHSLVVTKEGHTYGFGCSMDNRMGIPPETMRVRMPGHRYNDTWELPTLIHLNVDHARVIYACGGRKSSGFLLDNGQVVLCGAIASKDVVMLDFAPRRVVHVSVGLSHFGVVLDNGLALLCGDSSDCRLGFEHGGQCVNVPVVSTTTERNTGPWSFHVAPLCTDTAIFVQCGYHHTAVVAHHTAVEATEAYH